MIHECKNTSWGSSSFEKETLDHITFDLFQIAKIFNKSGIIPEYDWSKLKNIDFQEKWKLKTSLLQSLSHYRCEQCPDFNLHYAQIHTQRIIEQQIADLNYKLSDQNLEFLPDYKSKVDVLKELDFINNDSLVQLKGRVACEV